MSFILALYVSLTSSKFNHDPEGKILVSLQSVTYKFLLRIKETTGFFKSFIFINFWLEKSSRIVLAPSKLRQRIFGKQTPVSFYRAIKILFQAKVMDDLINQSVFMK